MNETINYDKRLNGVLNQNIGLIIQRVPRSRLLLAKSVNKHAPFSLAPQVSMKENGASSFENTVHSSVAIKLALRFRTGVAVHGQSVVLLESTHRGHGSVVIHAGHFG